jgi:energy-coupling factor transporter ATP-binding protein EcfA2
VSRSAVSNMTEDVTSPRHVRRRFRIELVGPAGAGKSTLCSTLTRKLPASTGSIWGQPVVPLLGNGIRLLPSFGPLWLESRSLLWDETRHMVRLRTLQRRLQRAEAGEIHTQMFDEGPVFSMAWLRGFGHETMRDRVADEWWRATIQEWASLIDVVVVLDAPDLVLAQRIRERAHDHEVKQFPDHEIAWWMARFRRALEWVLSEMSQHGGPRVMRLCSEDEASERIAGRIAEELGGTVHGH